MYRYECRGDQLSSHTWPKKIEDECKEVWATSSERLIAPSAECHRPYSEVVNLYPIESGFPFPSQIASEQMAMTTDRGLKNLDEVETVKVHMS